MHNVCNVWNGHAPKCVACFGFAIPLSVVVTLNILSNLIVIIYLFSTAQETRTLHNKMSNKTSRREALTGDRNKA